jgi:hypothetical protein
MTIVEMGKIMAYLFADFDAEVKREKLAVWFDQFAHIDIQAGWVAARLLMSRKSYGIPRAQDFAAALRRVLGGAQVSGQEAFDLAYKAAGRFGRYQKEAGLASLPERVRLAAERFGWEALCNCESPDLERGQFARIFESLDQRKRDAVTLPPGLKKDITAITAGKTKELPGPRGMLSAGQILTSITKGG